jgi:hypothetical protein
LPLKKRQPHLLQCESRMSPDRVTRKCLS